MRSEVEYKAKNKIKEVKKYKCSVCGKLFDKKKEAIDHCIELHFCINCMYSYYMNIYEDLGCKLKEHGSECNYVRKNYG